MRIVLAGATGFIGTPLVQDLLRSGHDVVVLTRDVAQARRVLPAVVQADTWNTEAPVDTWSEALRGADGVVNLAGTSIAAGRWSPARKAAIRSSRLAATHALVTAIRGMPGGQRPRTLVSASATGYYGDRGEESLTEESPPGSDFLAGVCRDWEQAARAAETEACLRVVYTRFGLVLGEGGGALEPLARLARLGLGGPLGSGRQWWSWVHRDDVVGLVRFALENGDVTGPVNVTAPEPVRMAAFATMLGHVLKRPAFLPAPALALRIAVGEMADALLLSSQRVAPQAALAAGYRFRYAELEPALRAIFRPTEQAA